MFNFSFLFRKNSHKFHFYSAHDSSLNALLVALDLINDNDDGCSFSAPPYAADFLIEVYTRKRNKQKEKKYYVKTFYCNEVN